ncbi:hypothetical protein FA13DRAFT_1734494 [Coprinellus micaceus]|uniref:Spindle pole body component n=1 Tax=Coprinellus micaceus TaxID=71717 RepID=A0A4Y7T6X4_COPMI|nr:hypothetical protein FA13DRAFT_1734494 [Coprinellus micaceus]
MDPYTPRSRVGARKKNIGLSTKEYTKITTTIASVRRNRMSSAHQDAEDDAALDAQAHESSFIAESSFVRAPLNSRVVSGGIATSYGQPSNHRSAPREQQAAPSNYRGAPSATAQAGPSANEALILEDLLFVLMGIEGEYIRYHPDYSPEDDDPLRGIQFVVSSSLDASLRDLVERILPLGTYYTAIYAFVEHRSHLDYGLVNHALCAAIRDMLKDYQTLLSQLEHAFSTSPSFSLQKLWFYEDEDETDEEERARNEALGLGGARLKAVLSEFSSGAGDSSSNVYVKGGEVLTIIYDRMQNMAGDPTAHTIYKTLLRAAARPYVEMLRRWVTTGKLVDPYEELLVKESKFIDRGILEMDYTDEYWERRYTLRDGSTMSGSKRHLAGVPPPRSAGGRLPGGACIPPLLEGKYLNVIRECGMELKELDTEEDLFMDEETFYSFLERAYSELRKSPRSASIVKLQSLLDLALGGDVQGEDALFKEDVKVTMADSGLYDFLLRIVNVSGVIDGEDGSAKPDRPRWSKRQNSSKKDVAIDFLTLDYTVKFPMSLVISRKTILRYQLLFRFLLHLKHVEQSLSAMWIDQKTHPWRCSLPDEHKDFERWRLRVCLLRARMLAFVQQILAFATFEVLDPNWQKLDKKLKDVKTVDQLLRDHVDFLDTCLKECMLTSSKLLKAYSRLIVTCATFAQYTTKFTHSSNKALEEVEKNGQLDGMSKRWEILGKFEANFNHWFQIHLDCVQFYASSENVSLLPLVVRLNSVKAGGVSA